MSQKQMRISENLQKIAKFARKCQNFCKIFAEICKICSREDDFLVDFEYLDVKIGVDPAESEPRKEWCALDFALDRAAAARAAARAAAPGGAAAPREPHDHAVRLAAPQILVTLKQIPSFAHIRQKIIKLL